MRKNRKIVPISQRHSPPARKEVLTKTYSEPKEITPVHVIKIGGK